MDRATSTRATLVVVGILSLSGACTRPQEPREIFFVHDVEGGSQLWRMDEDGSNARPFTDDTLSLGRVTNLPDRSPDGSRILFASGESMRSLGIFMAGADGSEIRKLDAGGFPFAQWPAWSPDGQKILFDAGPDYRNLDLYLMDADGSNVEQLTSDPWLNTCGRWSPDGTQILYTAILADTVRLMTLNVESGVSQPTLPEGLDAVCGDWSPDGRSIAFSSWPDFIFPDRRPGPYESSSVFVLDLATDAITQVTHLEGLSERPRWSRDGQWIAFNSTAPIGTFPYNAAPDSISNGTEIYLVRPDGSGVRRLTHNDSFDGHPVW